MWCLQVFLNVPVQPRDAREASDVFYKQNLGDVLLNYENEVRLTNATYGEKNALPYIVPDNNVRVRILLLHVRRRARARMCVCVCMRVAVRALRVCACVCAGGHVRVRVHACVQP